MLRPLRLLAASLALLAGAHAVEIDYIEDFALADDRVAALKQLIPGTEQYYYFTALHAQNEGRYAEVEAILEPWIKRYGHTPQVEEIRRRQALLTYDKTPEATLAFLKRELGVRLDHQKEVLGQKPAFATQLDPALLARERLLPRAFGERRDLSAFEDDALDLLVRTELNPLQRRDLIRRLSRPDYPNLPKLIADDLQAPDSAGFGSLPVHGQLLLAQLDELLALRPGLLNESAFVHAYIAKLVPPADSDWQHDAALREAYLKRLWAFVSRLAPAFNSLKAHVLNQRLVHDRSLGTRSRERFLEYIQLPRQAVYVNPKYLEIAENRVAMADLRANFEPVTRLPGLPDDEPLVRDYLMHFFVADETYDPFVPYIQDTYLKRLFAETKILAGIGDMERWYSLLNNPGLYQAIKERVEIEFAPESRTWFRPGDAVTLDVDVKNVPKLIVKVFAINTANYYRQERSAVTTDVNLDGLVAGREDTHTYDEPPQRRVRRRFEFPQLANRRGVFVIEFIGNGKSSRALVQKGQLRFLERQGAAGHVFTILDETNARVPGATLWLNGREYVQDEQGQIVVPYSTSPARQPIVLSADGFSCLSFFQHAAESYTLDARFHVERETLLRRGTGRLLLRPALFLNGATPAALSLLEEPVLTIVSTDLDGVESTREIPNPKLEPTAETEIEFRVPERLASVTFVLRGKVQNLSRNEKQPVESAAFVQLNAIDATERIQDLHLSRTDAGFVLRVLGKNGEPLADRPVRFEFKPRLFRFTVDTVLQSDARGRIVLGPLADVTRFAAADMEGLRHDWVLPRDQRTYPELVLAREGERIVIPYMGSADAAAPELFSLLETRNGTFFRDALAALALKDGMLELNGLTAGDYSLFLKEPRITVRILIAAGEVREGYVLGENRLLERRMPAPLQIAAVEPGDQELVISLVNSTELTRVHVATSRFVPEVSLFDRLAHLPQPGAAIVLPGKPESYYTSGRDIGDEYRYILERKYAAKFPGSMLQRPGLLLNPWALRSTEMGVEVLAGEGRIGRYGGIAGGRAAAEMGAPGPAGEAVGFASLDFLAEPAVVLANLRPDKAGVIRVPRARLGAAQQLHVLALGPSSAAYRQVGLPEIEPARRDLRLLTALDAARPFTEQRRASVLAAGQELTVADITAARVELYDTLGKVYRLYLTLSDNHPDLVEFGFLLRWPGLKPEEKRELYSKYACHELSFLLSRKDPEFFRTVVQPYLANKKDKTFLDLFLIGGDLKPYLQPWAYGRLNAVERILLGQRLPEEAAAAARHLRDLQALLPPDVERVNQLYLTVLQGGALETGDALGFDEARDKAEGEKRRKLAAFGPPAPTVATAAAPAPPPAAKPGLALARRAEAKKDADFKRERETAEKAKELQSAADAAMPAEEAAAGEPADASGWSEAADRAYVEDLGRDADRRANVRQLYRKLEPTKEWAENNYWHRPIAEQNADLVTVNRFWVDYAAAAGKTPFFSTHLAEASRSFTEIMFALAVLDLPFEAKEPEVAYDGAQMKLVAAAPLLVFHREILEGVPAADAAPVLVSQNYFRASDRYRMENGEKVEKYVSEEFLTHVVYGCQVVLTNPTSATRRLELLLQLPRGALPVNNGFYTKGMPVELAPYATFTCDYFFYFPAAGAAPHFTAHVARNEQFLAAPPPFTLNVVDTATKIDTGSWDYISQHATPDEVLAFLDRDNPNRVNLERMAWRLRDPAFFAKALDLLTRRHVYNQVLWGYGFQHNQPAAIREYLQHADGFVAGCGLWLDCRLLTLDPIVRRSYQHLEYFPLVNPRAHQVGRRRQILNDAVATQYHALLKVLSYRPTLDTGDLLSVTYYLLLQDRVEEALRFFGRVQPDTVTARVQYDYLKAYLDYFTPERKDARRLADAYRDYPVDRWRHLFRTLAEHLGEAAGKAPAEVVDRESREQQQGRLAATESTFDLKIEGRRVTVTYQNLKQATVNYYLMDIELLFSRNPFVGQYAGQFAFVQPNRSEPLALPEGKREVVLELPREYQGANLLVGIVAGGVRRSQTYFANTLNVDLLENYGQVRVTQQKDGRPVPGAYVKVFARFPGNQVRFYKDGYTDPRGRFDYSSLNTPEIDRVERFAILILSEKDGALIREAAPPQQ